MPPFCSRSRKLLLATLLAMPAVVSLPARALAQSERSGPEHGGSRHDVQIPGAPPPGTGAAPETATGSGGAVFVQWRNTVRRACPARGSYRYPCIRPDGRAVVYVGGTSWPPRLWRTTLDDEGRPGETVPLTPEGVAANLPIYSADGRWILFSSDSGQKRRLQPDAPVPWDRVLRIHAAHDYPFNLFVIGDDGKGMHRVTSGPFRDMRSCFSPDGHTIAFVSNRSGKSGLWSQELGTGAEPHLLLEGGLRPCYSPDGKRIYFHRHSSKTESRIWWIPAGGGEPKCLANSPEGRTHGAWVMPNAVLVHSDWKSPGGLPRLWVIPLDGKPARPVQPPGFRRAAHATRAHNGVLAFDCG